MNHSKISKHFKEACDTQAFAIHELVEVGGKVQSEFSKNVITKIRNKFEYEAGITWMMIYGFNIKITTALGDVIECCAIDNPRRIQHSKSLGVESTMISGWFLNDKNLNEYFER